MDHYSIPIVYYYGPVIIFLDCWELLAIVCTVGQLNFDHLLTWSFATTIRQAVDTQWWKDTVMWWLLILASWLRWLTAVHRLPWQSPRVSRDSKTRWLVKSVGRERGGEGGSNSPEKLPVFPSGSLSLLVTRFPSPNPITVYCFCEISNSMPADLVEGKSIGAGTYKKR